MLEAELEAVLVGDGMPQLLLWFDNYRFAVECTDVAAQLHCAAGSTVGYRKHLAAV